MTQYAGLDFCQVFNLRGTINCRRVLPGYAISESAPGGVHFFCLSYELCTVALVWIPAVHKCRLGFATWFNPEPQELQGRKTPPTPPPGYQRALKSHCFPELHPSHIYLPALSLTATFAKGRACTQLTWKALCCCHLGTGVEAISGSLLVSVISEVFRSSSPKYLVACSQVTLFWTVWEGSE